MSRRRRNSRLQEYKMPGGTENGLALRSDRELQNFDPEKAAIEIHASKALLKIAERIRDPDKFEEALDINLSAKRDFVAAYKRAFKHGGDRQVVRSDNLNHEDFCSSAGFSYCTVNRWAALLDEEYFESRKQKLLATFIKRYCSDGSETPAHVGENMGEERWFTPPPIIASAKEVMGEITLDPASEKAAQKIVQAKAYYTRIDDGLKQLWRGAIWLNPPYSQPEISQFIEKLSREWKLGNTTQAMTLTNNATETDWGQTLLGVSNAVCFPASRIKFISSTGKTPAPLQGQMICYLGDRIAKFVKEFSLLGICFEKKI